MANLLKYGETHLQKYSVFTLIEKKVTRNITHSDYPASTSELFITLNTLKLKILLNINRICLHSNRLNGMLIIIIINLFRVQISNTIQWTCNTYIEKYC